jgi:hypothetical protein
VKEAVGAVALREKTVTEVGKHAVVEAGSSRSMAIAYLKSTWQADRLGGLPARQAEQELQQIDGGQLGGREARTTLSRVPVSKVLVAPQPIEAVAHPHRRRAVRVDNERLNNCIGHRNHPSMPADHAAALRNSKIPDRVKFVPVAGWEESPRRTPARRGHVDP